MFKELRFSPKRKASKSPVIQYKRFDRSIWTIKKFLLNEWGYIPVLKPISEVFVNKSVGIYTSIRRKPHRRTRQRSVTDNNNTQQCKELISTRVKSPNLKYKYLLKQKTLEMFLNLSATHSFPVNRRTTVCRQTFFTASPPNK